MQHTTTGSRTRRWTTGLIAWALVALTSTFAGCDSGPNEEIDESCRFDPFGCEGGLGGVCGHPEDCGSGYCCFEQSNCGGGMCTYPCRNDVDCPPFMACEHDVCFFRCNSDRDCAAGQSCEHGNTVCEWP